MSSKASTTAQAPFNIRSADALIRTSDNVDFYLYKASTASTIPSSIHDPIPVTETSQTFDCLMRLCYPVDDPVDTWLKRWTAN
ncbi:hypothetical protein BC629DRAFT_1591955 [Irpex lacteus]|nr:hypothetical protein BC629DRAFT_1591955 [Irpex lacteus]